MEVDDDDVGGNDNDEDNDTTITCYYCISTNKITREDLIKLSTIHDRILLQIKYT